MFQLFHSPKIDFMGKRRLWVGVSLAVIAISLVILGTKGIRRGIEFEGGAEVQLQYTAAPDVGAVRDALGKAGFVGAIVTTIGKPDEHEVYVRVPLVPGAKDQDLAPRVVASLKGAQGADAFVVRSQSYIGPTIGRELVKKALGAILARWPACWSTSGSGSNSSGVWRPWLPSSTTRSSRWDCSRCSAMK